MIWTCSLIAYWGSFRMSELIPSGDKTYQACNSLTWNKVFKPEEGQLTLTVKFPKIMNQGTGSQAVDIYRYMDTNYCPIFQLASLYNMAKDQKNVNAYHNVFELESGKMLTMPFMNLIIRNIMSKFFNGAHRFSCHSFRAGVPSWMAANPHLFDEQEIKVIGRWSSQAYLRYTRLSGITRGFAIQKIHTSLYSRYDLTKYK